MQVAGGVEESIDVATGEDATLDEGVDSFEGVGHAEFQGSGDKELVEAGRGDFGIVEGEQLIVAGDDKGVGVGVEGVGDIDFHRRPELRLEGVDKGEVIKGVGWGCLAGDWFVLNFGGVVEDDALVSVVVDDADTV